MKTKVGVTHQPKRTLPWLVYWFGEPDAETGKQRRYAKSFKYKREAQTEQADRQSKMNDGAPRDKVADVTLGRLLDEFWAARVAALGYKSQTGYQATFDGLRGHFGKDRPIGRIQRQQAEAFMASQRRKGKSDAPLSSWTRRQRVTHCRAAFDAAIEWGYAIKANPFRPGRVRTNLPLRITAKSRQWHHLTTDQFDSLLGVVPSVHRRAGYWFMYGCGLRPGEMYNLTLDRIDLEARTVYIAAREATDTTPPFVPKSEDRSSEPKDRSIPIPLAAIPDITAACEQAFRSGGYVSLTPERYATVQVNWRLCREGKPWGGKKKHRPWQNADMVHNLLRDTKGYLRKAGIDLSAPFTLTTFRKSFGQNHADAATPPRTLAELMGHSKPSTTMEYYNRVTDANKKAAAETMDRLLGSVGRKAASVG